MNTPSTSNVQAAIYARVSSDAQAQKQTIDSQVAALREKVSSDSLPLSDENCFLDDGISGSTLHRPALERLRDAAYVGAFQKLYVHSPDRLARKYAYQVLLVDELQKQGIEIVFLNRAIGVSPEEDLLLQMQGRFAEYERAKIVERSRRGRRHAAKRGNVSVLSTAPFGYRYTSCVEGRGQAAYEIMDSQAVVVRQMFEWVGRDRLSIGEVTRRLQRQGIKTATGKDWWDRSSVLGMLKNPAYKGLAAFGKTRVGPRRVQLRTSHGQPRTPRRAVSYYDTDASEQISIPVPAIVSEELFETVQVQLCKNRQRGRESRRGATYLLQGLLECACCGYAYYGNKVSRYRAGTKVSYVYYRCTGSDSYRLGGHRVCDNNQVRTDKLDEAVWQDVCELLRNPQLLRKEYERRLTTPDGSGARNLLKKQLAAAQRAIDRLIDAYTDGVLQRAEFDPRLERARNRLVSLQEKHTAQETESREQSALREVLSCLDTFTELIASRLDTADWNTRREILRMLIERVLIVRNQIRIVYRINFPLFAKNASREKVLHFCWWRAMAVPTRLGGYSDSAVKPRNLCFTTSSARSVSMNSVFGLTSAKL
ncbi:MAG: recombinase family protein [Planctomycetales bacterium]|nr:recombinase family protein [Planctomycetales bacterium]